jgi:hypothetical protein
LLLGMRNIAAIGRSLAQHHAAHRIEMQNRLTSSKYLSASMTVLLNLP